MNFTSIQLLDIAYKAESMGLLEVVSDYSHYGWYLTSDESEGRFDYIPALGQIDLAYMQRWDELRQWVELAYGHKMRLYVGYRGAYEDRCAAMVIEPEK